MADDHRAFRIDAVDPKYRLCNIETDSCDRLHDWLLRIVGTPNSTHILGTHVPVEEPSTASEADKTSERHLDYPGVSNGAVQRLTVTSPPETP
jgi:hypothetical protein